jgi:hypothetical protein
MHDTILTIEANSSARHQRVINGLDHHQTIVVELALLKAKLSDSKKNLIKRLRERGQREAAEMVRDTL